MTQGGASQAQIRAGAYYDSTVLMRLQRFLADLPGVLDAGVMMGTAANKAILAQDGLLTPAVQAAQADDLVIVVRGVDGAAAAAALSRVDELLARREAEGGTDYRPRSVKTALRTLPDAGWVLISVPGRYAAGVAREALRLGRHLFLFSDNVAVEEEVALKRQAADRGLLVLGPDCGTAIVNGVGLGFANRLRRGPIGMVAASGTGLQQVSVRIHQLGSGLTSALGTGGRDLSEAVGAVTARQALDLLDRDPATRAIVLIAKPPPRRVADQIVQLARSLSKPTVIQFLGMARPVRRLENVRFAGTLDEAAELAVEAAAGGSVPEVPAEPHRAGASQRFVRGLYSGGTLAYEAQLLLQDYVPVVYSNAPLHGAPQLADPARSQANTVLDLGADEFTVGRLHPMLDNDLRIRRLYQEAADPEVAVVVIDVVLGYGSHPDPAAELAPAVARARDLARAGGRSLEVVAVVVGTEDDPQDRAAQARQLEAAGARVEGSHAAAMRAVGQRLRALQPPSLSADATPLRPVDLAVLHQPVAAANVGLESFADSLEAQGVPVVRVDWRPPAGGDERLAAILDRIRGT